MAPTCKLLKNLTLILACGMIMLTPPAGTGQERRHESPPEDLRTASAPPREPALEVKNITVKFEADGREKVYIDFSGDAAPELSSIEGRDPRIVIDIRNVSSIRKGLTRIQVGGKMIRQVRSNLDYQARKLRIVVDLSPSLSYEVEPVFYRAEKIYVLDVRQAPVNQKK